MGCMNQMDEKLTVCPHCGFNEAALRQESYYLKPGTIIGGKYIVGKALSYGGYTVTYIGMDAEKTRKVMIKEYLPSDFSTRSEGDTEVTIYSGDACEQFEQGLTTFLNEANRIGQLQNPQGIMRVYDCVAENDTGYVISEYLEGRTLKQIMEKGKRFPVQEAKEFVCRILEGLRQVHPLNIIHCDISPETILVTNTGEIKLLDFGATRYVTTANSKSLAIILKQGFAPEEQYRSRGERGPWTDVYALGAVMYYMITGVVPVESVDRALMDELKEPSKLGVQIPSNTENALMNALNVYQKDRTPSAEIFYQELNSPQVSRIQVKKQKYETGKFPTWAKFLVAGLLCVVVAGGVIVVKRWDGGSDGGEANSTEITAEDIVGMSLKEAEKKQGKNIKIIPEDICIFDKNAKEGGQIRSQEPVAGEKVTDNRITVRVCTSEKCTYGDLFEKRGNVDNLAHTFGIKSRKLVESKAKDKADEKKKYKDLYQIVLENGTPLKPEDLEEKKDEVITLAGIKSVEYYVSPYLYKSELENYIGKNISKVKFEKCIKEKDGKRVFQGKAIPSCDEDYYSFEKEKGYIIEQRLPEGETYNARKYRKNLFNVVKEKFNSSGSADELIQKLRGEKIRVTVKKGSSGSEIEKVEIEKRKDGGTKELFTKEDTVIITRKEKEQQPPQEKKTQSKPKETLPPNILATEYNINSPTKDFHRENLKHNT
jgi:Serine/threonine protein kinase